MDNLSPSPEKIENPQTQPINQDVLNLLKSKGKATQDPVVEKAKEQIRQYITQNKIDPNILIQVGQLCSQALRDPTMYQMAVDMAVKNGIMTKEEIGPGTNYKLLGIGITIGKLTQQIVQEGL
jgi:hypothetical protein